MQEEQGARLLQEPVASPGRTAPAGHGLRPHLQEGLAALLETAGRRTALLCESNSLRQVVEPGLILIVGGTTGTSWKRSAQEVRAYADAALRSTGAQAADSGRGR